MYKQLSKHRHPLMDVRMPFGFHSLQNSVQQDDSWLAQTDISENAAGFDLNLALPGCNKQDILVKVENQILKIQAERKQVKEENRTYHRMETRYGKFERSFRLGENADHEKIEARFEDGILFLHIPKKVKEAQLPAVIEVR